MSEDDVVYYNMKKNGRNKKGRMGVKTSNTVKYNVRDLDLLDEKTKFEIKNNDPNDTKDFDENLKYNVQYSINKDKRWELIKEMKKDEKVLVVTNK
jgi:hypothetical protein